MIKVNISMVWESIAGLIKELGGGLVSYVGRHLQQWVSDQLTQVDLLLREEPRKGKIILAECVFINLLGQIWWIWHLLNGRGPFKLEWADGLGLENSGIDV